MRFRASPKGTVVLSSAVTPLTSCALGPVGGNGGLYARRSSSRVIDTLQDNGSVNTCSLCAFSCPVLAKSSEDDYRYRCVYAVSPVSRVLSATFHLRLLTTTHRPLCVKCPCWPLTIRSLRCAKVITWDEQSASRAVMSFLRVRASERDQFT